MKINLNFYFTFFCGATKGFMNDFKSFIEHFEAPQLFLFVRGRGRKAQDHYFYYKKLHQSFPLCIASTNLSGLQLALRNIF